MESEISVPSDAELVDAARRGDEAAFTILFERHYPAIRAFAYRFVLDAHGADDVAQETFIQAAKRLDSLRNDAGVRAWLFQIAANQGRDRLRAARRRQRAEADALPDSVPGNSAASDRVEDALSGLPPDQRIAIGLVFFEGFTHREAAAVVGCAEATVSWRIMLAKRSLKRTLES